MTARKQKVSENSVKRAVMQYLRLKGHFWWVAKTMGVWDAARGCYRKDPNYMPGVSDILLLSGGVLYAIELKGSHGTQGTAQKEFEAQIKANGGKYILCRSVDDLIREGL